MNVIGTTLIRHLDCDKILVYTDVPEPEVSGIMTFETKTKPDAGETWIRNNFGDVAIKFIDRRNERV